ncbi:hypothetical protein ACFSQT_16140 [Mesorhizobium calcicola]|uniref:Uncharacterized protein n=1 Tax=Mesorhizobium calcicola TaxID=1300310 RepID=A0ABW4WD79_9HYPH
MKMDHNGQLCSLIRKKHTQLGLMQGFRRQQAAVKALLSVGGTVTS